MFIGRHGELKELQRICEKDHFQLFILYGRRRVGKTSLLKEFCRDKDAIFFSAELSNNKANLEKFSQVVFQHYSDSRQEPFNSWESALLYISDRQRTSRLVLVIDEFPYLAEGNPSILSELQHTIDHRLQESGLFLILCGSYMGFMEKEVLGSKSPLFGRRTGQLQLKPFDYLTSAQFMDGFSPEEKLMFYGAFGGTPLYLRQIDTAKSFKENIMDALLSPASYLYEEPMFLLREEVQQPGTYNAIIEAIASGASKANEISSRTGEDTAKCLKYIKSLRDLGILYKESPFGEKDSSRRTLYGISDFLFRFWYRYIFSNRTLLETDAQEIVWQRKIEPDYSTYMGLVFERVCREYLLRMNSQGKLPILFTSMGRWWGTDSRTRSQAEIDLIARDGKDYLFCECKWRSVPADMDVLNALRNRAEIFLSGKGDKGHIEFIIFSKNGFTEDIQEEAKKSQDLSLVGVDGILDRM
ncbi:MAG: ATP-binding protein [Fretibacterium sp.]|nr:ATP-binding protein [Fretibacterium sp.]